jgi:hypothetical protein
MPPVPKAYKEVEDLADRVSENVQYPIQDFKQLADALGGEDADIQYEGHGRKLGQIRQALPDGFFPVESREDLIAKAGYLQTRHRKPDDDHTPADQKDKPADDAGQPPGEAKGQARPGGVPALHGVGKKQ